MNTPASVMIVGRGRDSIVHIERPFLMIVARSGGSAGAVQDIGGQNR
jgi:hypothetical protein